MAENLNGATRGARRKGIGGHSLPNRGATDTWLTPPAIIEALGPFDLDPCAAPEPRPWTTAVNHITWPADGLFAEWKGRVWCNPPYGSATGAWMKRMGEHGHGTALIFARTETADWHRHIWPKASGILFLAGRIHFHYPDGRRAVANAGGPSALIAYGSDDAERLSRTKIKGHFVDLRERHPSEKAAPNNPSSPVKGLST